MEGLSSGGLTLPWPTVISFSTSRRLSRTRLFRAGLWLLALCLVLSGGLASAKPIRGDAAMPACGLGAVHVAHGQPAKQAQPTSACCSGGCVCAAGFALDLVGPIAVMLAPSEPAAMASLLPLQVPGRAALPPIRPPIA